MAYLYAAGLFVKRFVGSFFIVTFSIRNSVLISVFGALETERKMKKIDNSTMGGRMKEQRIKIGMTQEELVEKMFTTKAAIS